MMRENIILQDDAYKLTHPSMLRPEATGVFSYLSARGGPGGYTATPWVGLQYYLKEYLEGVRVTADDIDEAKAQDAGMFSKPQLNVAGWTHILRKHGGRLPVRICAAPEGSIVPIGNVLMTIENTDPAVPWLTNALEPLLLKVWYPSTVAARSWRLYQALARSVRETGGPIGAADYMLQDFAYRGVSSEESARIGAAAHLLVFRGSDTVPAVRWARHYYGASWDIAKSVAAPEHSIMTQLGKSGEIDVALHVMATHQNQVVSIVADSYDYYRFVDAMIAQRDFVNQMRVQLVIRPDSVTERHPTPEALVLWTLDRMAERLRTSVALTPTQHKVLPYGVLYGDGLSEADILRIDETVCAHGYAAHNMVYGMGGGLLQKLDRDTCGFTIKCSAQREGKDPWTAKSKETPGKPSRGGRLTLTKVHGRYATQPEGYADSVLRPVFQDGMVLRQESYADICARIVSETKMYDEMAAEVPLALA